MANAKDVVERGWRAYIARDLDALAAAYAEDAVLTVPGAPPAEGREAIRQLWSTFLDAFPHDSPTITRMTAEGDVVAVEFTSSGTNAGPLTLPTGDKIPATGRHVELSGVSISEVEGEHTKRETFYWDSASFLMQLGLMPEPATA